MQENKELNVPLIVFTLIVVIFAGVFGEMTEPEYVTGKQALLIGLGGLVLSPILVLWTRALWNTLIPRITSWREITFWEAAGLSALVLFFVG